MRKMAMFKIVTSHVTTLRRKNSRGQRSTKAQFLFNIALILAPFTGLNQRERCFIIKKKSNL